MKPFLHTSFTLLLMTVLLLANPATVLADEGDGEHAMEMVVNGIHVSLSSQNEWMKGEDTIVVTLMDSMGMPVTNADVEIMLVLPADEHAETKPEPAYGAEQGHSSMPGMEMGEPATESTHDMGAHG